ncbi:uncharacterized protein [Littorina saxatilis]|uniref:Uncharacterized protein n=1 Tax=Littorina saxatilis TaxID=31220 RepID=A0AAN9BMK1_9CAEN
MPKRSLASRGTLGTSNDAKKRKTEEKPVATKKTGKQAAGSKDSTSTKAPVSKKSTQSKSYPKEIDPNTNIEQDPSEIEFTARVPTRNKKGELVFEDTPDLRPNLTPKEVMQAGSFGGTYFRPIKSGITGKSYSGMWKELPKDWLKGLNVGRQVSCSVYDEKVNTYKVKCGGSLEMWESSGWMHKQDPYGWFQWYCRFYQGRRTADDERQIGRWLRCAGPTGRWRNNLISKCVKSSSSFDKHTISPVVRQTLQHWAYRLNKEDFEAYAKKMKQK